MSDTPSSPHLSRPAVGTSSTAAVRRPTLPPGTAPPAFLPPPPPPITDENFNDLDGEIPEEDLTPKQVWAVATYNYKTDDDEELALQQDEIIEILEQNDDGWWKGKNSAGNVGIFPHNFVTITENRNPRTQTPPPAQTTAPSEEATLSDPAKKEKRRSIFWNKKKDKSEKEDEGSPSPSPSSVSPISTSSSRTPSPPPGASGSFGSGAGLPSSRKLSDGAAKHDTGAPLKTRSNTLSTPQPLQPHVLRSSSSSPSLPLIPPNANNDAHQTTPPGTTNPSPRAHATQSSPRAEPTPSPPPTVTLIKGRSTTDAHSLKGRLSADMSNLPPPPPSPLVAVASANSASSSPPPASSLSSSSSSPPPPASSPTPSPAPTPTPAGESFIMKVHVPPSGSSQVKVSTNQTIGDLIAMVAKKRSHPVKDCSLQTMSASPSDPPLDSSTPISALPPGTRELRLTLTGESAASVASAAPAPAPTPASPAPTPSKPPAPTPNAANKTVKEGYVMKSDKDKKMKKVWAVIDKSYLCCFKTSHDRNPTEKINLYCAQPKHVKKGLFDLITPTNTYSFSADGESDAVVWVNSLQEACQALIMQQLTQKTTAATPAPVIDKAEQKAKEQQSREQVVAIRNIPENKICADCSTPDPDWAAINLGVFFCIECSGIHRALGVHLSQVRSVILDFWDPTQINTMEKIGNKRANEYWEFRIPPNYHKPTPNSTIDDREKWIRHKYEHKTFADPTRSPPVASPSTPSLSSSGSSSPTLSHQTPPTSNPLSLSNSSLPEIPVKKEVPGLEFVGYGFFNFQDDPSRPAILRRQVKLFQNEFGQNQTTHVAMRNAPAGARRMGVEFLVPDHFSVDTSSALGFVPSTTKVFDNKQEYNKFLASHTNPQLDSYRQTVSLHNEPAHSGSGDNSWWVVTELNVELYALFITQVDEKVLSPHVYKAAPLLAAGDSAMLAQFIKKNGTHFVRSAIYGGRVLMKTEVPKAVVADKDEAARLCDLNFRHVFPIDSKDKEGGDGAESAAGLRTARNYTLDVTGGDNRKRGLDWIDSIWDKPQVLSYELESISDVFDDLALSLKVAGAIKEHMERIKA